MVSKGNSNAILPGNFNDKFKNNIRDMFIYQYKGISKNKKFSDFKRKFTDKNQLPSTFSNDISNLKEVFANNSEIIFSHKNTPCYCTIDSRFVENNPFFSLYRYTVGKPDISFFIIILALNSNIDYIDNLQDYFINEYENEVKKFKKEQAKYNNKNSWDNIPKSTKKDIFSDFTKIVLNEYRNSITGTFAEYISACCKKVNPYTLELEDDFPYENYKTLNQLYDLYKIIDNYNYFSLKNFKIVLSDLEKLGIIESKKFKKSYCYKLRDNLLNNILKDIDTNNFCNMINFFSETTALGVVGTFINNRIGNKKNIFSYKHMYFYNTLNDYNICDLLYAIKNKLWIKVFYRNGINLISQSFVCYPIEIRQSTYNGRQHLICYNPKFRSVTSIRIDFIDRIAETDFHENHNAEIENAKESTKYLWGVGYNDFLNGNVKGKIKVHNISVKLKVEDNEEYIVDRVVRESRIGKFSIEKNILTFTATVTQPGELYSWIKTFAKRILSVTVDEVDVTETVLSDFVTETTVSSDSKHIFENQPPTKNENSNLYSDQIFNEIFNLDYEKAGNCIIQHLKGNDNQSDELFKNDFDLTTVDIFELKDNSINNFYDLLPLTKIEIQWLKYCINNSKAKLFLEENQLSKLKDIFTVEENDLPISSINYYDKFKSHNEIADTDIYIDNFKKIVKAFTDEKSVKINYKSANNPATTRSVNIGLIEYSNKDDKFRIYCKKENSVSVYNLERINSVEILSDGYNRNSAEKSIKNYILNQRKEITLEFTNVKNIPDRLLTEFTPWEKLCTRLDDRYNVTIKYDKQDSFEIVTRLLPYGKNIKILSDTGNVKTEIENRINKQLSM